jgi:N-acetyl-gamma-glutamyl-phosphate reductase
MIQVFIDGEAGTTGLQIRDRLASHPGARVLSIDPARRKDPQAKAEILKEADACILCLHDDAARETVAMVDALAASGARTPRLIDASTAHRVTPGWVYGFPEISETQHQAVQTAQRVANPGCYATGAIALLRPLLDAGVLPPDFPACLPAVSGYSGGGRAMIEAYEAQQAPLFELYALGLEHKHIPEIMALTGLKRRPLFVPSVGNFRQGMLVQLPIHLDDLAGNVQAGDLLDAYQRHYAPSLEKGGCVRVMPTTENGKLDALALNDTNLLEIRVFHNATHRHAVCVARLDNLGKGASGAAVQNLSLMFGL